MISKNSTKLSLDNVCKLLRATIEEDSIGNQIKKYAEREIFCTELPVYSNEFYAANQQKIKLQKILAIDFEEYEQETSVMYENNTYSIFKSFLRSDGFVELYCCEKIGD